MPGDEAGKVVRVAVAARPCDDDRCAAEERPEELPHRGVEGVGRLQQEAVWPFPIRLGEPREKIVQGTVAHRDTLGPPGGAGGEQGVDRVIRVHWGAALGVGHGSYAGRDRSIGVDPVQTHVGAEFVEGGGDLTRGDEDVGHPCGLDHVLDAAGGCLGVDRDVLPARGDDRVHRDEQFHRSFDAHADRDVGSDTGGDEFAREGVHAGGELGVVHDAAVDEQCGRGRVECGCGGDHSGECPVFDGDLRPGRPVADAGPFVVGGQVDGADGDRGVGGDGVEQTQEPCRHRLDGPGIEKVCRVDDADRPARLRVESRHGDAEIDLGRQFVRHDRGERQVTDAGAVHAVAGEFGDRALVEGQHHLGERRERFGANRIELLDQRLERQVGVPERVDVGLPYPIQQVAEGDAGVGAGAQHQRVDEHADQRVEGGLPTPGDRCGDGDVVGGGQPAQQHRQCGVHHHERGGTALLREVGDAAREVRRDLDAQACTALRGDRGPGPVGRQVEHAGQVRELAGPVIQLGVQHRTGVVGGAEHPVLPDRDVGELHRQRREVGGDAVAPRLVGGHHVGHQRRQRFAVGGDVVQREREHVLIGPGRREPGPHRPHLGDVEAHRQCVGDAGGFGHRPVEAVGDAVRGVDLLVRDAVLGRVAGAQDLVPHHHVGDGGVQGVDVEGAVQPQRDPDVVGRRCRVEAVDEPHPLLRG